MFGFIGGLWNFYDSTAPTVVKQIQVGNDSSPSKIKAAFDTAFAALAPTSKDTLFGVDPRGKKMRYTSVALGKKFQR